MLSLDNGTLGVVGESEESIARGKTRQFSTFYVNGRHYGIDVMAVQEVLKNLPMSKVHLAPEFVHGLINLRGQIATAISLRDLFNLEDAFNEESMNVVCKMDDNLLALLVDKIGDVVDVVESDFEDPPDTIPDDVRRFMVGVYKMDGPLLSIIGVEQIKDVLNDALESSVVA